MKRQVRLTESDLHRIIKKSVNRVLKEGNYKEKMSPEELFRDIYGGELSTLYTTGNDIEAYGKSGRMYRCSIGGDYATISWSPDESPMWEEGGEFVIRNGERGFRTLIAYLQEYSQY